MSARPPTVTATLSGAERSADVADVLRQAFAADPIVNYYFPSKRHHPSLFRAISCMNGSSFGMNDVAWRRPDADGTAAAGQLLAAPPLMGGVAVWEPAKPTYAYIFRSMVAALALVFLVGPSTAWKFLQFGATCDEKRELIGGPHAHHLMLVGALPGQGYGSAVMRHGLARADAARAPCYLENSNPRNTALYERFGFRVVEELRPDGGKGPSVLLMLRPAQ